MSGQWTVPAWLVLAAAAAIGVLVVVALAAVLRRGAGRDVGAETAELRTRVEDLEQRLREQQLVAAAPSHQLPHPTSPFTITRLGEDDAEDDAEEAGPARPEVRAAVPVLPPGQFADVVLREGALRSAALAHGLRRALSPEVRHRIRGEMRREVKRSRKARRAETREALRHWQAQQRADGPAA